MFKNLIMNLLDIYKKYISYFLVFLFGNSCRFKPTCSEYSKEAIKNYGILKGSYLSIKRLIRCNPLSRVAFDPVP